MSFTVTPTGAGLGAEIAGLSLTQLGESDAAALHQAWLDHQVVLLRDQKLSPEDLIARYTNGGKALAEGTLMFCGTFAAKGGIRPADRFDYEIEDPVLGRKITGGYAITTLPVLG